MHGALKPSIKMVKLSEEEPQEVKDGVVENH